MKKHIKYQWTEPERDILRKYYPTKGADWCREILIASGFPERTRTCIGQAARLMGLVYQGLRLTQYKKGRVPENKGKKMSPELRAKVAHTFFQKGSLNGAAAHNKKTSGTETIRSDGYLYVKKEDGTWAAKHRAVWEAITV